MNLKFCSCRACRFGRKSKWNQSRINQVKGGHRIKIKSLLKQGKYDKVENKIGIVYTS